MQNNDQTNAAPIAARPIQLAARDREAIVQAIIDHRPFDATSMAGRLDAMTGAYVVTSYAQPIAQHVPGQAWKVDGRDFSPTTRKHQRIVTEALTSLGVTLAGDLGGDR